MTDFISEWQDRLDREGAVRFQQSRWRTAGFLGLAVLFVAVGGGALASEGLSVWAVFSVVFFGLCAGVFAYQLATGWPRLTVTRTGLTFNDGREIAFHELRELHTSNVAFGVAFPPRADERLRGPWQRKHGLKYARIVDQRAVHNLELGRWVARLSGVAIEELEGEPRLGKSAWVWRLPSPGGA